MSNAGSDCRGSERLVARLLRDGTWLASVTIAAGLGIEMLHHAAALRLQSWNGFDVVEAGVAALIFLPIARVALMLVFFLRERDYLYSVISALVLAIIGTGLLVRL